MRAESNLSELDWCCVWLLSEVAGEGEVHVVFDLVVSRVNLHCTDV